ncbi:myoregulin isoform X1 [Neovison vison]|uniref:myoregulin isoform X1 n=1 Tax=Neovison vison TaxID=452646 RepID=UPI001CEFD416|nr:myoregulin isoform X1 [Neogale vison]
MEKDRSEDQRVFGALERGHQALLSDMCEGGIAANWKEALQLAWCGALAWSANQLWEFKQVLSSLSGVGFSHNVSSLQQPLFAGAPGSMLGSWLPFFLILRYSGSGKDCGVRQIFIQIPDYLCGSLLCQVVTCQKCSSLRLQLPWFWTRWSDPGWNRRSWEVFKESPRRMTHSRIPSRRDQGC